jgi:hypothetical protein
MTAALTVSGLAGSMPAAHAGGSASCIFIGGVNASLVCTGNNTVNIPITVTVTGVGNGNDISLIETEIENVIVGNGNTVILEALNVIGNSVATITNLHCVSVQVGSGNVAITKVCAH